MVGRAKPRVLQPNTEEEDRKLLRLAIKRIEVAQTYNRTLDDLLEYMAVRNVTAALKRRLDEDDKKRLDKEERTKQRG